MKVLFGRFALLSVLFIGVTFSGCAEKDKVEMPDYPALREVVTWFYNNHDWDSREFQGFLKFAKTPKGWEVYTQEYNEEKLLIDSKHQVIWENGKFSKANGYSNIEYSLGNGPSSTAIKS